jgi:uncharacterized membrane protein
MLDAVSWLRAHAASDTVVVEAVGSSYSKTGVLSSYAGVPSLLTWPEHVGLRGLDRVDAVKRQRAITRIYTAENAQMVWRIATKFNVQFVFIGDRERAIYGETAGAAISTTPDKFTMRRDFGVTRIFEVRRPTEYSNEE